MKYFTGRPCKNGHISERWKSNGTCIECAYARRREHPEYDKRADAKRAKTEYRRRQKRLAENNRRQREDVKAARRAERMARIAKTKHRTPKWSDLKKIREIYQEAQKLGPAYHVDHIIPLNGDLVSGLHVPENLQIIPAKENLLKGSKLEPMWANL